MHKVVAGGLIAVTGAGMASIGWALYSLYVLRPRARAAEASAHADMPAEAPAADLALEAQAAVPEASSDAEAR